MIDARAHSLTRLAVASSYVVGGSRVGDFCALVVVEAAIDNTLLLIRDGDIYPGARAGRFATLGWLGRCRP